MRDRGLIWAGLAVFFGFLTLPVWHNLSAHVAAKGPEPVLPALQKQCVAPVEFMKTSHMRLLLDWRESVVRQGARDYVTPDGRHYSMSLTNTCLRQCHTAKADFCDRCHNYEAVSLPCWDCHLDSKTPVLRGADTRVWRLDTRVETLLASAAPADVREVGQPSETRRDESRARKARRGRHECPRHVGGVE